MRFIEGARSKYKREHPFDMRVTSRQARRYKRINRRAPEEHKISIEIMCLAFFNFGSFDDSKHGLTARAWSDLGWWQRWLHTWQNIGWRAGFPKLRKIVAQEFAMEITSVQPMHAPSGALFYMNYQYQSLQALAWSEDADT